MNRQNSSFDKAVKVCVHIHDVIYTSVPIELTQTKMSVLLSVEIDGSDEYEMYSEEVSDSSNNERRRFIDKIDLYQASDRKRFTRDCYERCGSVYSEFILEKHLEKVIAEVEKLRDNVGSALENEVEKSKVKEVQVESLNNDFFEMPSGEVKRRRVNISFTF